MSFEPVKVEQIELAKFKTSTGPELYRQAKALLEKSGLITLLRIFARPFTIDRGANPYTAAYTAAFCEGYNKCLDDIMYFDEMFLDEKLGKRNVKATFGALALAVQRGDLTAEEAKGLANGR